MDSNWIRVDNRLPASDDFVLIHLSDGFIAVGYVEMFHGELVWRGENCERISLRGIAVTHWQPLPEVPGV